MQTPSSEPPFLKDLDIVVDRALSEDIGDGDITAMLIPAEQHATAEVITREAAVVCGRPWFDRVFHKLDPNTEITWKVAEGDSVEANQLLVEISGNARALLTGERSALNFLQLLMGTATTAKNYADLANGTRLRILDTRKTIPGLRLAQKYAIKTGGCENHRIGLYDAFLIKENHIQACGSISRAISSARKINPDVMIEIEVENLGQLCEAIVAKADRIMLDNFDSLQIHQALTLKPEGIAYELSGNLTDDAIVAHRQSGIDFISSGALTKHCRAIDLSMRLLS